MTGERALVVVDMIHDFADPTGALYCGPSMPAVIAVITRELARARAAREPVVYLTDDHLPDDAEFQMFPPHAIHGTIDTLRLVGDCTNICVLYTAADARNLGYAVEVVRDGVTSFDLEAHRDALRELEKTLGAKIV
jgi:nicotinamidase/pyrazinamidase